MKKGISLITLIITIIVVVILAGAIILNLEDTNVIENAEIAVNLSDLKAEMTSLELFHAEQMLEMKGTYKKELLMTDVNGNLEYNGEPLCEEEGNLDTQYTLEDIFQSDEIKIFSGQVEAKDPNSEIAELIEQVVPDTINPVITVLEPSVKIAVGDVFVDSGVSVVDNRDSNIIFNTSGTVNSNIIGDYKLTYTAIDSSGNPAITRTKTVKVIDPYLLVTSIKTRTETLDGSSTTGSYDNPVIPKGFKAVNATGVNEKSTEIAANWNFLDENYDKGLVIQDVDGNQYVWIPVNGEVQDDGTETDGIVTYNKWTTHPYSYDIMVDGTLPANVIEEDLQIQKYKGFYIGRFEAGINGDTSANTSDHNRPRVASNLVSKEGVAPWNFITHYQAKELAESKYTVDSIYGVYSGILTGTMYDTLVDFLKEQGYDVIHTTSWSNCYSSTFPANISGYNSLQVTGYSDYWSACNMYDVAGNTFEWVDERSGSTSYPRGGHYANVGCSNSSLTYRWGNNPNNSWQYNSFRLALYIP